MISLLMVSWLIIGSAAQGDRAGAPTVTVIGTFSKSDDCTTAAKAAKTSSTIDQGLLNALQIAYVCIPNGKK